MTEAAPAELSAEVPVLDLRGVSKTFPGTKALDGVDLQIGSGEIHALVGANGSGKSTLIKTLAGYHHPDPGAHAQADGREFELGTVPADSSHMVRFVHQDLGLILELSAADNLALKSGFLTRGRVIDWKAQRAETRRQLARLGMSFDVDQPLTAATPVQRTVTAIAGALAGWESGRGLLVLDEPTAVLPHTEVELLLDIVREVRRHGASILYVSHRLDEIFQIADRVTVLRDGRKVGTFEVGELDQQSLAELMVGGRVRAGFRLDRAVPRDASVALEVRDLAGGRLVDLSLDVRRGEILGVAGLAGSGADDVPYLLAGARKVTGNGRFRYADGDWRPTSALAGIGIPLVPADRGREGVIADFSVGENLSLSVVSRVAKSGVLRGRRERALIADWVKRLEVKVASADDLITTLSGGNQQKVVLGRALAGEPKTLLLAEPTAGVDIGTRQAIYTLIGWLADETGLSVIVTSTDATDLIAMCGRVLVVGQGEQVGELRGDEITERNLMTTMEARPR